MRTTVGQRVFARLPTVVCAKLVEDDAMLCDCPHAWCPGLLTAPQSRRSKLCEIPIAPLNEDSFPLVPHA